MIHEITFSYKPKDDELAAASGSYLMSLVAIIIGLPIPIINLIATLIFFFGNRKSTYFVRWHCTQALLSQIPLLFMNSIGFWWTFDILFNGKEYSNYYFAYAILIISYNILEFIFTIISAIKVRKGIHIEWWALGAITHLIHKQK